MASPPRSKQPVHRNEPFVCAKCGHKNNISATGCRNHCTECLYSKHVDLDAPGDRLSTCNGLMEPVSVISKSGKDRQIIHLCLKCGKKEANIIAPDDNIDTIIRVMQKQNIDSIPFAENNEPHPKRKRRF